MARSYSCFPKTKRRWRGLFLACLLLASAGATVFLVDAVEAESDGYELQRGRLQLNRVIKQLMDEKKALGKVRGAERGLLDDLEEIDRNLSDTEKRLEFLDKQQQKAEQELPELEERVRVGNLRVEEMQQKLKAHIRLVYGMGGQGLVKVAFSQKDPARVRQSVLYYGRLIHSRTNQFKAFQESIDQLDQSVSQHQKVAAKIELLSVDLTKEREAVLARRQDRAALLRNIRKEARYREQKVEELSIARSSLTSFMERLSGLLESTPEPLPERKPIESPSSPQTTDRPFFAGDREEKKRVSVPQPRRKGTQEAERYAKKSPEKREDSQTIKQARGKLLPPVRAERRSRKPGLFFQIAENTPVKAIHKAQVVFADWFRGYGLLIILDHGDQIYSLYGHNKALMVSPGDWVEKNQTIAKSGDTGSLEGIPGLYFEIRRRGKAVNPNRWLVASR
ncbi:MAG: peptidoglycan DD-metalloendopeptidase family protein [Magnetococcales bacterium]|nr:peptidoglycan DD-metalloendopeptidase family protein [Magnetococcales bacterium]